MARLAIYPGSFDPPTLGHLDVVERAARLFDRIVVAVGSNPGKSALMSVEERVDALSASVKHLPNVEVATFKGLLISYAAKQGASAIVRGLRATADFEYEFQMAMVNRRFDAAIETVFLMTKWEYSYLSSSIVREVALLGGEFASLVPGPVVEPLRRAAKRAAG
ncbi:MAG: pantetheine-phosphate adenylyltransferase [Fimbriimonas ginsengisoli]|uniref:Phosphopantetheine adenylyltransferase n=1 Tax=Fimbriimonas ginsengisoli TaxID=1005039 RepID=A0A931PWG6_FIMGI|nr:pantetheine-phosphate adenylyltransferase [Fimbriimonas ginsengisoli]MBI3720925.1 pantetheine-phosphate adenylyltransferase [Fimbriimonas ginsengisoli]